MRMKEEKKHNSENNGNKIDFHENYLNKEVRVREIFSPFIANYI